LNGSINLTAQICHTLACCHSSDPPSFKSFLPCWDEETAQKKRTRPQSRIHESTRKEYIRVWHRLTEQSATPVLILSGNATQLDATVTKVETAVGNLSAAAKNNGMDKLGDDAEKAGKKIEASFQTERGKNA